MGQFRLATAAIAASAATLGMVCAPAAAQVRLENLTAVDLFELADKALETGNPEHAAALYDALSRDPDLEIRTEARFRKGMMLANAGRFTEAAIAFRAALDEKPDAVRIRLELARMQAAAGDEAAARRTLRQVETAALPPEVAATVGQFARALQSTKRFGGSVEVSFAPDTNINRATEARTLDTIIAPLTLSRDARARSGLGMKLAGQGYARVALDDELTLVPRVAGTGNIYRESMFNDIAGSALLGLEWQSGRNRLSPSIGHTWRWYGDDLYARTQTLSLDWLHVPGPKWQLITSGSVSRARYMQNDLQDGEIYNVEFSVERALDVRSGLSLSLSATRQSARDPGYATVSGGVSLLGWREMGRATVFASAGLRRTEGDERLFLFPERRREWLVSARAGATLRQFTFKGFAPVVRVVYERNQSSVGIYDYRRLAGEIGIVRAF